MQLNIKTKRNKTRGTLFPIYTSQIGQVVWGRKLTQGFSKEDSLLLTEYLASHSTRELKLNPSAKPLCPSSSSHQQQKTCGCAIHFIGNWVTLYNFFLPPARDHGMLTNKIISFTIVSFCIVFFPCFPFFTWQHVPRETVPLGNKRCCQFFITFISFRDC